MLGSINIEPNCFTDISECFDSTILMLKDYDYDYDYEIREFPHSRSNKAITARDSYRGVSVGVTYA